jgi:hypothetical protein
MHVEVGQRLGIDAAQEKAISRLQERKGLPAEIVINRERGEALTSLKHQVSGSERVGLASLLKSRTHRRPASRTS